MTGILSKIIKTVIKKNLGYDVDITINSIKAVCGNGKVNLKLDVEGEMSQENFKNLIFKQL
jgi:hypothetical protein